MPYSAEAVANAFFDIAAANNKQLTNMQLQKLVFLAQGYSLALLERCMFENHIHAWQWGPVIPRLYKKLQQFGSGTVTSRLEAVDSVAKDSEEYQIVEGVWGAYKDSSGAELSALTHREGSPWSKAWAAKHFGKISIDDMKEYYLEIVAA